MDKILSKLEKLTFIALEIQTLRDTVHKINLIDACVEKDLKSETTETQKIKDSMVEVVEGGNGRDILLVTRSPFPAPRVTLAHVTFVVKSAWTLGTSHPGTATEDEKRVIFQGAFVCTCKLKAILQSGWIKEWIKSIMPVVSGTCCIPPGKVKGCEIILWYIGLNPPASSWCVTLTSSSILRLDILASSHIIMSNAFTWWQTMDLSKELSMTLHHGSSAVVKL
ncbi:uncharacterized protein LOC144648420 [Oculina patagonica]